MFFFGPHVQTTKQILKWKMAIDDFCEHVTGDGGPPGPPGNFLIYLHVFVNHDIEHNVLYFDQSQTVINML